MIDLEWLIDQHHNQQKTLREIASEFQIRRNNLAKLLKDNNIEIRRYTAKANEKAKHTNLKKYGYEHHSKRKEFAELIKQTSLERFGVEHYSKTESFKTSVENTNLERFGVTHYSQTEECKSHRKETNLTRYGGTNQTPECKRKTKETNLKRYGTASPTQNEDVQAKVRQTVLEHYGVDNVSKVPEISAKKRETYLQTIEEVYNGRWPNQIHLSDEVYNNLNNPAWLIEQNYNQKKSLIQIALELNVNASTLGNYFKKFNIEPKRYASSITQNEVVEYIKSIVDSEIVINNRQLISPREIDIYLPEHNLAIEVDGVYWHSFDQVESSKERRELLQKSIDCAEQDIHLIHVYDSEWTEKQSIVKSIIAAKLGVYQESIYARKCGVKDIDSKMAKEFLDHNHLQGNVYSKINFGLFFNDELVSLMTFSKPRFSKKYQWELVRFCNRLNTKVIGGASKLLHYFKNVFEPQSIVSYADLRYSDGGLYKTLDFTYVKHSKPNYFYTRNSIQLESRNKYQKHKLAKLLSFYVPALTESENMFSNGYRRIWDCGNGVYEWFNQS